MPTTIDRDNIITELKELARKKDTRLDLPFRKDMFA